MNDKSFKIMLIKVLEKEAKKVIYPSSVLKEVIDLIPICEITLEETNIFSRVKWDTFSTILHIQVPFNKEDIFKKAKEELLQAARRIYRKEGYILIDLEIDFLLEENEIINFSGIANIDVIKNAISDAELFMNEGRYDSAFDRIHTAFHGFLRNKLDNLGVNYVESDTLVQLYTKLHSTLATKINSPDVAELIKTAIRSGVGIISAINDIRNRHSLAHPNNTIIDKREAELTLQMIKVITDYINKIC
jgi:hypothetical protein